MPPKKDTKAEVVPETPVIPEAPVLCASFEDVRFVNVLLRRVSGVPFPSVISQAAPAVSRSANASRAQSPEPRAPSPTSQKTKSTAPPAQTLNPSANNSALDPNAPKPSVDLLNSLEFHIETPAKRGVLVTAEETASALRDVEQKVAAVLEFGAEYFRDLRKSVLVDLFVELLKSLSENANDVDPYDAKECLLLFKSLFTVQMQDAHEEGEFVAIVKKDVMKAVESEQKVDDLLKPMTVDGAVPLSRRVLSTSAAKVFVSFVLDIVLTRFTLLKYVLFDGERSRAVHVVRREVESMMDPIPLSAFELQTVYEEKVRMAAEAAENKRRSEEEQRQKQLEESRKLREEASQLFSGVREDLGSREQLLMQRLLKIEAALEAQQLSAYVA
eukprot:ANDGO_05433.mRNA.1 hypothetical protein